MNRRGFLGAILATGVAPYVVTAAGVLMPVRALWTPDFWIKGADRAFNSLQAALDATVPGDVVCMRDGLTISGGTINFPAHDVAVHSDGMVTMSGCELIRKQGTLLTVGEPNTTLYVSGCRFVA